MPNFSSQNNCVVDLAKYARALRKRRFCDIHCFAPCFLVRHYALYVASSGAFAVVRLIRQRQIYKCEQQTQKATKSSPCYIKIFTKNIHEACVFPPHVAIFYKPRISSQEATIKRKLSSSKGESKPQASINSVNVFVPPKPRNFKYLLNVAL